LSYDGMHSTPQTDSKQPKVHKKSIPADGF
jgi:hypothetical protein